MAENEVNEEIVSPEVTDKPKKKTYAKSTLTKGTRLKIIDDDKNGIKNPDYEVCMNKNGAIFVKKRKVPLTNIVPEQMIISHQNQTERIVVPENNDATDKASVTDNLKPSIKLKKSKKNELLSQIMYYNTTAQQDYKELLTKRIDGIQQEMTNQKSKHKKLKQKYKKLKYETLYEPDEDEVDEPVEEELLPNDTPPQSPRGMSAALQQVKPKTMRDTIDFNRYFH